jgi:outer membrane protein assembly factor BamB
VLAVGQKSDVVHALDSDQEGKILWQTPIGKGGPLGGIMWGSAADQERVYVANSDLRFLPDGTMSLDPAAGGGLFALDLATGKVSMQVRRSRVVIGANAALRFRQRSPQFPVLFFRVGLAAIYVPMPPPTPGCFGKSTRRAIARR